jgi:hypothetical protein
VSLVFSMLLLVWVIKHREPSRNLCDAWSNQSQLEREALLCLISSWRLVVNALKLKRLERNLDIGFAADFDVNPVAAAHKLAISCAAA